MADNLLLQKKIELLAPKFQQAQKEMSQVIIGQKNVCQRLWIALLTGGHLLIEGMPGLAKTLAVKTLAKIIKADFSRIQFTPDLLPADIIGTAIYHLKEGTFSTKKGPIFTQLLLADEINRAPAKVQSALLEAMAENQISLNGELFKLPFPFLVLATQNPIEQEGTYRLPEAQMDRFMMKVRIDYPTLQEEKEIMQRRPMHHLSEIQAILSVEDLAQAKELIQAIYLDEKVADYLLSLTFATREPARYQIPIEGQLQFGVSPRATLALKEASQAHAFLDHRSYVTPDDIKQVAPDILRHRLILSYEAEAEGIVADEIVATILSTLKVP